jgi:hypothetical protein
MLLASAVSLPAQAINLVTNGTLTPSTAIQTASPDYSYRISFGSTVDNTSIPGWSVQTNQQNNYAAVTPTGTAAGKTSTLTYTFALNVNPGQTVESPTGQSGWFLQFDGDTTYGARITQDITNLTPGQDYRVSFYQAGATVNDPAYNQPTYNQFRVYFTDNSWGNYQTGDLMNMANNDVVQPWSKQTMIFTASAVTQHLAFWNIGGPSGQPPVALLSDISVEAVPWETDTLPLVGSTVLFGFGLWAKKKFAQKKLK